MKVIGITGGIGSGKTTVCKVFEVLGVPVFYADDVSKRILFSSKISQKVIGEFGEEVVEKGVLDKNKLASFIFSDPSALQWLENVLHPEVALAFEQWKSKQKTTFVLKEAAILFESGSYKSCDAVVNVCCSEEVRIKRVMKRDGKSRKQVEAIIQKQWSESKRQKYSDYLIFNEEEKLFPQIVQLNQLLLSL